MTEFAYQRPKTGFISLTSLMDVLTILLVFLLVNFTTDPQPVSDNGVRLPHVGTLSATTLETELAERIPIEVRLNSIRVGKEKFLLAGNSPRQILNHLEGALSRQSQTIRDQGKPARILLRGEANLPFRFIDLVLQAATSQSITDVKLVGRYQEVR